MEACLGLLENEISAPAHQNLTSSHRGLAEFSSDGLSNTLLSQGSILETAATAEWYAECTFQGHCVLSSSGVNW